MEVLARGADMVVAASQGHAISIYDIPNQRPTSKINGGSQIHLTANEWNDLLNYGPKKKKGKSKVQTT